MNYQNSHLNVFLTEPRCEHHLLGLFLRLNIFKWAKIKPFFAKPKHESVLSLGLLSKRKTIFQKKETELLIHHSNHFDGSRIMCSLLDFPA